MKTVKLTDIEITFLRNLLSDAGELVPDDYYKDFASEYQFDNEEFFGHFYGVPILEPTEENEGVNRDTLLEVVGGLNLKFKNL